MIAMRVRSISLNFLLAAAFLFFLSACEKDELAFDVIESPVLAVFEDMTAPPDALKMKATFYELDKTGILDLNVGIDSLPVSNLSVSVFVFGDELVGEFTTDSEGTVLLEATTDQLKGASRLEWVGEYDNTAFRIFRNF